MKTALLMLLLMLCGCISRGPATGSDVMRASGPRATRMATALPAAAALPAAGNPIPATVHLGWTASTSTNVTGYRLWSGPAHGQYTNSVVTSNTTTGSISNLTVGATYYFAATAFTAAGDGSDFSNEVVFTPTDATPIINLVITVEHAATPDGPWTTYPVNVFVGPATDDMQVFRAAIQKVFAP